MHCSNIIFLVAAHYAHLLFAQSTTGITSLVQRRLPAQADQLSFELLPPSDADSNVTSYDAYTISTSDDDRILIQGQTLSALSSGLHRYLSDVTRVDIWWFIGSRLDAAPAELPRPAVPITGASIVPWRYYLNTVTFSYTTAFWTWDDWELHLDWMALHGINLPLAWVGVEKIIQDVFLEAGFTSDEIKSFLSAPAYQAWNRFGNIQGSWNGQLSDDWIEGQFALQKLIVGRMVELGMTPVLPSFTGFVPTAATRVFPEAQIVNGSAWNDLPLEYTNTTFLEPTNPEFSTLQTSFIMRQKEAYGNVTHIYTLDQYNENTPFSGDLDYLRNTTSTTMRSLKTADPNAIWLLQGWLFHSSQDFWTTDRIEAYLSGVEKDSDMLVLDLVSESSPQWQRTQGYFGKPWIWCQLHDYGGTSGLYGQIENITTNAIEAFDASPNLVGFGLTPEGLEGNEIIYTLLLDQAWSRSPIDTSAYFADWVSRRYTGNNSIPIDAYAAWQLLRESVYNNTNLTVISRVPKSILDFRPALTGLLNRTTSLPSTIPYDTSTLQEAWTRLSAAGSNDTGLWENPAYTHDIIDISRQVLANTFQDHYVDLQTQYAANASAATLNSTAKAMLDILDSLDRVLASSPAFSLSSWTSRAAVWAQNSTLTPTATNTTLGNFTFSPMGTDDTEYVGSALDQITLWGPPGELFSDHLRDYASKQWAGLVSGYYRPRWEMFLRYIVGTPRGEFDEGWIDGVIGEWESAWVEGVGGVQDGEVASEEGEKRVGKVVGEIVGKYAKSVDGGNGRARKGGLSITRNK